MYCVPCSPSLITFAGVSHVGASYDRWTGDRSTFCDGSSRELAVVSVGEALGIAAASILALIYFWRLVLVMIIVLGIAAVILGGAQIYDVLQGT